MISKIHTVKKNKNVPIYVKNKGGYKYTYIYVYGFLERGTENWQQGLDWGENLRVGAWDLSLYSLLCFKNLPPSTYYYLFLIS